MSKTLIIAEKPSVAADIARALGGFTRHDDYFEGSDYVLSSAVGHLLEIGMPEEEEVKRGKWTFAHLPAIPSKFALKPIEKNEARLKLLVRLIKRKDVVGLDQRLRRRPRGRAHLPVHRAVREDDEADPPPVAAVDDHGRDPRRLRPSPRRRRDAPARRCRGMPLRVRLAGRHQRHARDDRVQFEVRRLPADDGRARADPHAGDPRRARGEDPRIPSARLLGGARHVRRERRRIHGPLVRRAVAQDRRGPGCARGAPVGGRAGTGHRREVRGQAGRGHRGSEADDAGRAAALRPHDAAARGQRPVRLLRAHHPVARAGALREAQGAHLSAHRLARVARGLHRHGQGDDGGAGRGDAPIARLRTRC